MKRSSLALCAALCVAAPAVHAQTITSRRETTPYPGVRIIEGRTSGPATDFRAAIISLCTDYVHVTATRAPTALQRTSAWASAAGVEVATNGDFFVSGPRVYGYAIGNGVAWPVRQTGIDPAVAGEWYYRRYGWIAFGARTVEFSHTEWVKQHAASLGVTAGWMPTTVTTAVPRGLTALVSGFPELITEGHRVTCASPTASSCFPDRTDMRARNPRTAMGLTRDRRTFILLAVDGRSSTSAGMYGTEEARLMELLGAWQAFNLDGGGSTTLWQRGRGVLNHPSDATGERVVANHWGIFAGSASGRPRTPGSCVAITPVDAGVPDAGPRDAAIDSGARDAVSDVARDVTNDLAIDRVLSDIVSDRALGDIASDRALTDIASDRAQSDAQPDAGAPVDDLGVREDGSDDAVEEPADDVSDELDDDAGPTEELPEFGDAAREEMPPIDAVDEPGCGCRSAPAKQTPSALTLLFVTLASIAIRHRKRQRQRDTDAPETSAVPGAHRSA